jgi:hypothetical protein
MGRRCSDPYAGWNSKRKWVILTDKEIKKAMKRRFPMPDIQWDVFLKDTEDMVKEALKSLASGIKSDLQEKIDLYLKAMALDIKNYAQGVLEGNPEAVKNLEHLKAQAQAVTAIVYRETANRSLEFLDVLVVNLAKYAGLILKGLLPI